VSGASAYLYLFAALLPVFACLLVYAAAKRLAWLILVSAGALLLFTWEVVNSFAEARHWAASQMHEIALAGDWLELPLLACSAIALVIVVRSSWRDWRRPSAGEPPLP
jgi:hypothetical protein